MAGAIRRMFMMTGLAAAMMAGLALAPVQAQPATDSRRVITVSGEGEIAAAPDQARLTAGVVTVAVTAGAALDENTRAMNAVFAALKRLGIPDNKIRTSNFNLSPQYPPVRANAPEPREIAGYQVSNQVTVIVDDISKVGATLDTLIRSGANQSGGVSFAIADPKPLAERARRAAVADAIAKARTLADAAGIALGTILSIQESGGVVNVPGPRFAAAMAVSVVPVAAGEQTVSASVTITYAIQ